MNSVIKSALLAATLMLLAASGAQAQYPGGPMDQLGGSIDHQIWLQQQGDDMANRAGWEAYRMLQEQRALGNPIDGPIMQLRPRNCGPVYDPHTQHTYLMCE